MFKKWLERGVQARCSRMESKLPHVSDDELKEWYSGADTQRVLGNICKHERKLLHAIEAELDNRGFEYQLDY